MLVEVSPVGVTNVLKKWHGDGTISYAELTDKEYEALATSAPKGLEADVKHWEAYGGKWIYHAFDTVTGGELREGEVADHQGVLVVGATDKVLMVLEPGEYAGVLPGITTGAVKVEGTADEVRIVNGVVSIAVAAVVD